MSASDFENLYDFEVDIESATAAILVAGGIDNAYPARSAVKVKFPCVLCKVVMGRATGKAKKVLNVVRDMAFEFQIHFQIFSERSTAAADESVPADHSNIRKMIRYQMSKFATSYSVVRLPKHVITSLTDQGCTPEIEAAEDIDTSAMSFSGHVQIRDSAWPENED